MKGWIFSTQSDPSYETRRLIECFTNDGIDCHMVHPNHVDIYISREDRKSVLVENEYTSIPDFAIPRVGSSTTYYQKAVFRHLERMGVLFINGSDAIDTVKDKLYTMQILAQNNRILQLQEFINQSQQTIKILNTSLTGIAEDVRRMSQSKGGSSYETISAYTNMGGREMVIAKKSTNRRR